MVTIMVMTSITTIEETFGLIAVEEYGGKVRLWTEAELWPWIFESHPLRTYPLWVKASVAFLETAPPNCPPNNTPPVRLAGRGPGQALWRKKKRKGA